jgi:putative sigma-54 modulation protein
LDMVVKARHLEIRPDVRAYAEEKVGKVARILNGLAMSVEVELYQERNRSIGEHQIAEVTVFTKGHILRARESASDMKAAIDKVAAKLERQARRFKEKVVDRHVGKIAPAPSTTSEAAPAEPVEQEGLVVKKKRVDLKPMSEEEAILQLELLGHDFFLFASEETGAASVLYRRRDGDYGLIQPRA